MSDQAMLDYVKRRSIPEPMSGCWLWLGSVAGPQDHARGYYNNRSYQASHLAWMGAHEPIPDRLWVLHRCDNPPCVNPDHLFLGTRLDNVHDCVKKGRHRATRHPESVRGERNPTAKLTEEQVRQIRSELAAGAFQRDLALKYGVSQATIARARSGECWSCVDGADITDGRSSERSRDRMRRLNLSLSPEERHAKGVRSGIRSAEARAAKRTTDLLRPGVYRYTLERTT